VRERMNGPPALSGAGAGAGGGMQTRGPQKAVSRKGREGASPSRRTEESEPIRDRASLLTSARLRLWRSCLPLSATENEPVRARAPVGSRLGGQPLGFKFSVLRSWMVKLPRSSPPARTRVGP
jgi:hypothetical protein